jgi:hypothetical protein
MAAHPDIAKIERESARSALAATTIGSAPVTRTEPKVLSELSDAEIRRLADEIMDESPYLSDEELFRQINARAQRPQTSAATKRHDDAMGALRKVADEIRKDEPRLSPEGAFVKAMKVRPDLAKVERLASRQALYAV